MIEPGYTLNNLIFYTLLIYDHVGLKWLHDYENYYILLVFCNNLLKDDATYGIEMKSILGQ